MNASAQIMDLRSGLFQPRPALSGATAPVGGMFQGAADFAQVFAGEQVGNVPDDVFGGVSSRESEGSRSTLDATNGLGVIEGFGDALVLSDDPVLANASLNFDQTIFALAPRLSAVQASAEAAVIEVPVADEVLIEAPVFDGEFPDFASRSVIPPEIGSMGLIALEEVSIDVAVFDFTPVDVVLSGSMLTGVGAQFGIREVSVSDGTTLLTEDAVLLASDVDSARIVAVAAQLASLSDVVEAPEAISAVHSGKMAVVLHLGGSGSARTAQVEDSVVGQVQGFQLGSDVAGAVNMSGPYGNLHKNDEIGSMVAQPHMTASVPLTPSALPTVAVQNSPQAVVHTDFIEQPVISLSGSDGTTVKPVGDVLFEQPHLKVDFAASASAPQATLPESSVPVTGFAQAPTKNTTNSMPRNVLRGQDVLDAGLVSQKGVQASVLKGAVSGVSDSVSPAQERRVKAAAQHLAAASATLSGRESASLSDLGPAPALGVSAGVGGGAAGAHASTLLPMGQSVMASVLLDVRRQGWTKTLVNRAAGMAQAGGVMTLKVLPQNLGQITLKLSEGRKGLELRMTAEVASTAAMLRDVQGQIERAFDDVGLTLGAYSAQTGGQGQQGRDDAVPHLDPAETDTPDKVAPTSADVPSTDRSSLINIVL